MAAESNDNPGLNDGFNNDPQFDQANRFIADAQVRIRKIEPRSELTFEPRVRSDAYAEDETQALESTDVFFRSYGVHRGANVRVGYAADVARERLLGVEFLETLPDDPLDGDPADIPTAQLGANELRTRLAAAPYVEIAMNSRTTFRIDASLVDVDYESDAPSGRTDFFERSLGGEYRRLLDERGTFGVRVFATGYRANVRSNVTDTVGLQLSYGRNISEIWSWNVAGGVQSADFAFTTGGIRNRGEEDTGTFSAGVRKRGERSTMRAEIGRRMSPDAIGAVIARDEVRVSWSRRFTQRVDGGMVLRAIETDSMNAIEAGGRRYGRAEFDLGWAFSTQWSFVASYAHATARSAGQIATGESDSLTLGVRFRGRPSALDAEAR